MSTISRNGAKSGIEISFMSMMPIENTLEKGQKSGDATKVITSDKIGTLDNNMPTIDAKVGTHDVKGDNKNKKRRELQKAIIEEQKIENNLSEERE